LIKFRCKKNINTFTTENKLAVSGNLLSKKLEYVDLLKEIQSLVALPEEYYSIFYTLPLENFLALYQLCNVDKVQLKLKNIIKALKLRRTHNLPFGVKPEDVKGYKDIWTYVIFVASLLYKIPDITEYSAVHKSPEVNSAYKVWNPYSGAIKSGDSYIVRPNSNIYKNLTPLTLLPILFDQHCTAWLYSDLDAFNCMLTLAISPEPKNILGRLIIDSNNQSNQEKHIGHDLYFLLIEAVKKNIVSSDKINNYVCRTNDGHAIAIPDIFNYYSVNRKVSSAVIEECFYSLEKHRKSSYKVTFPNIGKKEAIILLDIESPLQ